MLPTRQAEAVSEFVFPNSKRAYYPFSSFDHLHSMVRRDLNLPGGFVLHSLCHTCLTRLGEAGAGAFEVGRHSNVTLSQTYAYPTPEALENAVERMDVMNQRALRRVWRKMPESDYPATKSATVAKKQASK